MPLVAAYFRPDSLDEALSLLAEPNRIPLAGGTIVNADRTHSDVGVVDLQALGLDAIEQSDSGVRIGATAKLHAVAEHSSLPDPLRDLARREQPSSLRTLATVGGTIATGDADSMFLAGLLVHGAQVRLAHPGGAVDDHALGDVLSGGVPAGSLITSVELETSGRPADAITGRTPADVPIVGAVARAVGDDVALALTGVGSTPVLVDPADPTRGLQPPDDFRGSSDYRRHLATVLAARAEEALR